MPKKKATSGTQRFTKGGKTLRVQNLSKKQLNYYSEMVDYGFFDIGIDGEINENKNDLAIEKLKQYYKVTNSPSPRKCSLCKGRFDKADGHNIRTCPNKTLHGKSNFASWPEGEFKFIHIKGNEDCALEDEYKTLRSLHGTLPVDKNVIEDSKDNIMKVVTCQHIESKNYLSESLTDEYTGEGRKSDSMSEFELCRNVNDHNRESTI